LCLSCLGPLAFLLLMTSNIFDLPSFWLWANAPDESYSRNTSYVLNSISIFHSLLLVWSWTNVKICLLNQTFYKTNRIYGYVYLIFKQNESS
jgi:hypothetical protein